MDVDGAAATGTEPYLAMHLRNARGGGKLSEVAAKRESSINTHLDPRCLENHQTMRPDFQPRSDSTSSQIGVAEHRAEEGPERLTCNTPLAGRASV